MEKDQTVPRCRPTLLHLYHLASVWAPYDEGKRQIVDAPRVVAQLYRMAQLAA